MRRLVPLSVQPASMEPARADRSRSGRYRRYLPDDDAVEPPDPLFEV